MPRRRSSLLLALGAVLLSVLVGVFAPNASAALAPGATAAHPFSSPVWWPLRAAEWTDCDRGNPGCPGYHTDWELDIVSQRGAPGDAVYAMGAGILHVGAISPACGPGTQSRGTWVWVDHGGGVESIYGHLNSIKVKDGTYVTPQTVIATVGHSGYSGCHTYHWMNYLYLAVKHNGRNGVYVPITSMYACRGATKVQYPQSLNRKWTNMNQVPKKTPVATGTNSCIPSTPATPSHPVESLSHAGAGTIRVSWAAPSAAQHVTSTRVEYQQWNAGRHVWNFPKFVTVTSGRSVVLRSLLHCEYKVRTLFGNGAGYSPPSAWHYLTPTG